jgi:RHS repeat-associated protein
MTDVEGVSYGYDNNGNQTSRGASDTFTFDHENRMTQSVVGGVTSSSVYYGSGVRKSHTVNGSTTNYKYDILADLPVVIQDGTYSYVYGLDLISMTDGSGNQKYLSYDGLGSVTDITNGSGAVTDTFAYDVFGSVTARTGSSATIAKFTGEQADDGSGDSGYYFLRARHYDTATGRFVGRDRIEFSQRYAYANNSPVLFADPNGLCFLCNVTRLAVNLPITVGATVLATAAGGSCRPDQDLFITCTGTGSLGPIKPYGRGGTTIGNTFMSLPRFTGRI